jgi:hypothetical protein
MAKQTDKAQPSRILVKKISTKTVYGGMAAVRKAIGTVENSKSTPLFDVMGIARGIVRGESDLGPWLAFIGQFEAMSHNEVNKDRVYYAGRLFLPGPSGDLLLGQMNGDGSDAVEFAFTVSALRDDESSTGYTYTAEPMIEVTADDPLERLRQRLRGGPLRITSQVGR